MSAEEQMKQEIERRVQIVELKNAVEANTKATERTLVLVERLSSTIHGDGDKPGVVGRIALHDQSINRIYKWVSGVVISIVGVAFAIIRMGLVSG